MQTDVFTVAFKLLCKRKKKAYWQAVIGVLSHNCPIFTIQFSFIERNSYAIGGYTGPPSAGTVQLWETATFFVNLLLWFLGCAWSLWTKPWGWLFSSSYCCQHAWPSRSTSRASLTLCWRMKGQPICLQQMTLSYLDLDQCAPFAASAIFAWYSALT